MEDRTEMPVQTSIVMAFWPRFEDGMPVMLCDRAVDIYGNEFNVRRISINSKGDVKLYDRDESLYMHIMELKYGERAKRPNDSMDRVVEDMVQYLGCADGAMCDMFEHCEEHKETLAREFVRRIKALEA